MQIGKSIPTYRVKDRLGLGRSADVFLGLINVDAILTKSIIFDQKCVDYILSHRANWSKLLEMIILLVKE